MTFSIIVTRLHVVLPDHGSHIIASYPGSLGEEKQEPGTHYLRMCLLNHDDIPSFLYIFVHIRAQLCYIMSFVSYLDSS